MTIDEAAQALQNEVSRNPWYIGIGIGEHDGRPSLYLYVKHTKGVDLSFLKDGWKGFHVEIQKTGKPKMLSA